tara:strand:+ start:61 stop:237 length:177 start_codon:yes stop_codon:yes gene_type:complete
MSNFNMGEFLRWAQKAQEAGKEGGDNKAHLDRHQTEKRESLEDVIRKNAEKPNNKDNS